MCVYIIYIYTYMNMFTHTFTQVHTQLLTHRYVYLLSVSVHLFTCLFNSVCAYMHTRTYTDCSRYCQYLLPNTTPRRSGTCKRAFCFCAFVEAWECFVGLESNAPTFVVHASGICTAGIKLKDILLDSSKDILLGYRVQGLGFLKKPKPLNTLTRFRDQGLGLFGGLGFRAQGFLKKGPS